MTFMRLLSEQDVERLMDIEAAISAATEAYRRQSAGLMPTPGRLDVARRDPHGSALVLAGHSSDRQFALKSNLHAYADPVSGRRNAASLLTLWDAVVCAPLALIATTGFNNHRTAAGFAAAARLLARADACTLAVFGAGKIAPATVQYLAAVRPINRVLIVGRGPERARQLAETLRHVPRLSSINIEAETDPARAARAADIIATISTSSDPVFPGEAVRPGTFVILGGANRPLTREADDGLMKRSAVYVDYLDGCLERAGDVKLALASGALERARIAGEIGSLVGGEGGAKIPGTDVVVFKSIGIAAQDILLAQMLLARAEASGIGLSFDPCDGTVSEPVPALTVPAQVSL
jgi:ornithine cyclodeaminase